MRYAVIGLLFSTELFIQHLLQRRIFFRTNKIFEMLPAMKLNLCNNILQR